jgi:mannobiose 2-epimerase
MNVAQSNHKWRAALTEEARAILRYWMSRAVDRRQGGFFGRIDGQGVPVVDANRGLVLNARIIWTFAAAARHFEEAAYRRLADWAFDYFMRFFFDESNGGYYWMIDYQGRPVQPEKWTYGQSFAIYGLSEYYLLTSVERARDAAIALYRLLERKARDAEHDGYLEVFSQEWSHLPQDGLFPKNLPASYTMNTHLHLLEAYTNLYRAWPDEGLLTRLRALIVRFLETIIDPQTTHLRLFFDRQWGNLSDHISFGHDIEAAWLLTEAMEAAHADDLKARVEAIAVRIAELTLAKGVDKDGGLYYEAEPHAISNPDKHWWPQAEAMVGFYNAYQLSGEERFLEAARKSWRFIRRHIVDRQGGEWFSRVDRRRRPNRQLDKASAWKAPYHNTRACLEMILRI